MTTEFGSVRFLCIIKILVIRGFIMLYGMGKKRKRWHFLSKMCVCLILSGLMAESSWAQSSAESILRQKGYGDNTADQTAFLHTLDNTLPLSPGQIKILHKQLDNVRRASASYPGTMPRPVSKVLNVDIKPGATPPVLRLQAGFVTTLVFTDVNGEPWPIQAYDNGNPNAYGIANDFKANPSALMIQGKGGFTPANLVVMLKGLSTPVSITLLSGQPVVDYRVDMIIPRSGPNTTIGYVAAPQHASPQLLDVLDGVPLPGAKRLQVSGGDVEAWRVGDFMYVRTSLALISPSWVSTMSSSDGTHAYQLRLTSVLLASKGGSIVPLSVKGL